MIGISPLGLVFALLLLAVPLCFFWRVCPKMLPRAGVAIGRMVAQLAFVGFYMHWLFWWDSVAADAVWLLLLVLASVFSVCGRTRLRRRVVALPLALGLFVSVVVVGLYVLLLVLRPAHPLSARYVVPVAGLLLYGAQVVVGTALTSYYKGLQDECQLYDFLMGNGATHLEAVAPFFRRAVEDSFSSVLVNMAVLGLVTLPQLTMGQLLGGVSPAAAVAWTIVLVLASACVSVFSLALTLYVADSCSFDANGRLRRVWAKR